MAVQKAPVVAVPNQTPAEGVQQQSSKTVSQETKEVRQRETALQEAIQRQVRKFNMAKMMVVGQGGAGKTCFMHSVLGMPYRETESTVGINALTCSVGYAGTGRDGLWQQIKERPAALETALAQSVYDAVRSQREGAPSPDNGKTAAADEGGTVGVSAGRGGKSGVAAGGGGGTVSSVTRDPSQRPSATKKVEKKKAVNISVQIREAVIRRLADNLGLVRVVYPVM